jgi:hypothetical protein
MAVKCSPPVEQIKISYWATERCIDRSALINKTERRCLHAIVPPSWTAGDGNDEYHWKIFPANEIVVLDAANFNGKARFIGPQRTFGRNRPFRLAILISHPAYSFVLFYDWSTFC